MSVVLGRNRPSMTASAGVAEKYVMLLSRNR